MDVLGKAVTLKKKTTGQTMTRTISGLKVKLDNPIQINTAWYQDTVTHVDVPTDVYEIQSMSGGAAPQSHMRNIFKAIRKTQGKTLKRSEPGRRFLLPTLRFNRNLPANTNRPKNIGLFNTRKLPNFQKMKQQNKEYIQNLVQSRRPNYQKYSRGKNFPARKQYLYQKFAQATEGRNDVGSMMRAIRTMNLSEEDRYRLEQRVLNLYGNINAAPAQRYNQNFNVLGAEADIQNW